MADSAEKTEEATPKRRQDAKRKGQVFSSKDIVSLATIIVGFSMLRLLFPSMVERLASLFHYFSGLATDVTEMNYETLQEIIIHSVLLMGVIIFPLVLMVAFSGIIATGAQTRFNFSTEAMRPKFERMDPLKGLKRMISLRSIVELVKSVIKLVIILVVIYKFISSHDVVFARMLDMGLNQSAAVFFKLCFTMAFEIIIGFAVIAAADFLYQKYDYNKNLKMSKQEVKEEYKQEEGDPKIKSQRQQMARQIASRRMMQQVPEADVIIRNPTHYAIAFKYEASKDIAPRVVAKGADELAMRIVRVGEQNNIFIQEDPELTRAIYAVVEIGEIIPYEFYNAIADLLALVYRLKNSQI